MATLITITSLDPLGTIENVDGTASSAIQLTLAPTLGVDSSGIVESVASAEAAAVAAELSEDNALVSESNAATSESNAATSESNAATSESNAATSESNAAQSAQAASEDAVQTSQDAISTAQDALSTAQDASNTAADRVATAADVVSTSTDASNTAQDASNTAADRVATAADHAATDAAVIQTNADVGAANASKIAAETAAQAAEAAFDNFDDKYLGSKTVAPTEDNDGDPLQVGATYWHDYQNGTGTLFYWNGIIWEAPDKAASASAQAAQASAQAALTSEGNALAAANSASADASATAADVITTEAAKVAAELAESNASVSSTEALGHKNDAEAAKDAAALSETSAEASAVRAASAAGDVTWKQYASKQVDMEREREANKNLFAASGFVHYSKNVSGSNYHNVNEGLFTRHNDPNYANNAFIGRVGTSQEGTSETPYAVSHIAGFVSEVLGVSRVVDAFGCIIKFPEAPDGTIIYDSTGDARGTGKANLNLLTEIDPKYGDIAVDTNEANARAFEGDVRNGDFRLGAVDWGAAVMVGGNLFSAYGAYGSSPRFSLVAGVKYRLEVGIVDVVSTPQVRVRTADGVNATYELTLGVNSTQNNTTLVKEFIASSTGDLSQVLLYCSVEGRELTVSHVSVKPVTEEVVTERVDMFGGEFFLEEVNATNPYVYPKGMIQSQATEMNGITTVRSNRPSTYYSVFDGDDSRYNFDGVDDYISIPQCDLVAGDTVTLKFIAPSAPLTNSWPILDDVASSANELWFSLRSSDQTYVFTGRCSAIVDGVAITSGVTPIPMDGLEHTLAITVTTSARLSLIGTNGAFSNYVGTPIYDVDIQAVSGNRFYRIDDGAGATEIVDSLNPDTELIDWTSASQSTQDAWIWTGTKYEKRLTTTTLCYFGTPLVAGVTYELSVTKSNHTTGEPVFRGDGTDILRLYSTDPSGVYSVIFTAASNGNIHVSGNSSFLDLDNVSLKEYTNGTPVNFNDANWNTGSTGLGVDFLAATDEQKQVMVSDTSNNIYFMNDGSITQWRMRQRTVSGAGNSDWFNTNPISNQGGVNIQNTIAYAIGGSNMVLRPQGMLDDTPFELGSSSGTENPFFIGNNNPNNQNTDNLGVFHAVGNSDGLRPDIEVGVNGECFFHVWGTVPRLNQGVKHPFNDMGSAKATDGYWYQSSLIKSLKDCFTHNTGGDIASGISGRNDGKFYDAIYPSGQGGVIDDRLSAYEVTLEDVSKAEAKLKNGSLRGMQKLPRTEFSDEYTYGSETTVVIRRDASNPRRVLIADSSDIEYVNGQKVSYVATEIYMTDELDLTNLTYLSNQSGWLCYTGDLLVTRSTEVSAEGNADNGFTCQDVIGDPANILLTPDLVNGWLGHWVPVIPDGTGTTIRPPATRKILDSTTGTVGYNLTYSFNLGSSWSTVASSTDTTLNTFTMTSTNQPNVVAIYSYYAAPYQTEQDENRPVLFGEKGVGSVWANAHNAAVNGCTFMESLTGKVCTSSGAGVADQLFMVNKMRLNSVTTALREDDLAHHESISLSVPNNDSPAAKVLIYPTSENQQVSLNVAYNELVWAVSTPVNVTGSTLTDVASQGDTIRINTTGMTGVYVRCLGGYGTNTFDTYLSGHYWVSAPNGDIVSSGRSSTEGEVYWKRVGNYNGGSWGDDSTVRIINGQGTYDNLNGDTCLYGSNRTTKKLGYTKNRARVGEQNKGVDL